MSTNVDSKKKVFLKRVMYLHIESEGETDCHENYKNVLLSALKKLTTAIEEEKITNGEIFFTIGDGTSVTGQYHMIDTWATQFRIANDGRYEL